MLYYVFLSVNWNKIDFSLEKTVSGHFLLVYSFDTQQFVVRTFSKTYFSLYWI